MISVKELEVRMITPIFIACAKVANPQVAFLQWPLVMFLLAKLILDNLMNQTSLEELEEELKPEILPSELRDASVASPIGAG